MSLHSRALWNVALDDDGVANILNRVNPALSLWVF